MTWMAEYEIEEALRLTASQELPNLRRGAEILSRLKDWTNSHSDGWPYWQKPGNAAVKLMDLLHQAQLYRGDAKDATEAELKKALPPIKAFLTKQGVDHALILNDPPPPPPPVPVIDREELRELVKTALNSKSGDTEWSTLVQIADMVGVEYNDEKDVYQ